MLVRKRSNLIWNISFVLWFIGEFAFVHTTFSTLGLLLFCGEGILSIFKRRTPVFPSTLIFYILFTLICVFETFWGYSVYPTNSWPYVVTLFRNILFLFCFYNYAVAVGAQMLRRVFIISACLTSVLMMGLAFANSGSISGLREIENFNPNGLSINNAFVFCWTVCTIEGKPKRREIAVCIVFLAFCFLSGTRKSLFIILLALFAFFCMRQPKKIARTLLLSAAAIYILYLALMKIPALYESLGVRIENVLTFAMGGEGDASINSREDYIELGMRYFARSPIWGNGVNCFVLLKGAFGTYSHNNYVELLFSTGIVGTVAFYLMYVCVLMKGFVRFFIEKERTPLFILGLAFLITRAITDYGEVIYYERSGLIIIVLCEVFLFLTTMKGEEKHDKLSYYLKPLPVTAPLRNDGTPRR